MLNILFILPFDIFPPAHGGSAIAHCHVASLVKEHNLALVLTRHHTQGGSIDLVHPNLAVHYCHCSPIDKMPVIINLCNPFLFTRALKVARQFRPDIIHCENLWSAFAGMYTNKRVKRPLLFTTYNAEYYKFKELSYPAMLVSIIKKIEMVACHRADKILTLSEQDREHIKSAFNLPEEKIETLPPGIDTSYYKNVSAEGIKHKLGLSPESLLLTFVGNFNYLPNVQAVAWIAEHVYPSVIDKFPNAEFFVIGQAEKKIRHLKREKMHLLGYLSKQELASYLSATDLFLVPVSTGSGIRTKILEAAASRTPVVSTKKGAEGLVFKNGRDIIITDNNASDFTRATIQVLSNPSLRKMIAEGAYEMLVKQYGCEHAEQKMKQVYYSMVKKREHSQTIKAGAILGSTK